MCAHECPAGFTIGEMDVRGPCEPMDGLVPEHQEALEALVARLRRSLGSASVGAAAAAQEAPQ
jgi:hypothetical protein